MKHYQWYFLLFTNNLWLMWILLLWFCSGVWPWHRWIDRGEHPALRTSLLRGCAGDVARLQTERGKLKYVRFAATICGLITRFWGSHIFLLLDHVHLLMLCFLKLSTNVLIMPVVHLILFLYTWVLSLWSLTDCGPWCPGCVHRAPTHDGPAPPPARRDSWPTEQLPTRTHEEIVSGTISCLW